MTRPIPSNQHSLVLSVSIPFILAGALTPDLLSATEVPLSTSAREPVGFHRAGNRVVFAAENAAGDPSLWSTSGTAEDTSEIFDPCPDPCDGIATIRFVGSTEALTYFTTVDESAGPGQLNLFRTDGTREGTFPLLPPSIASGLASGSTPEAFGLSGSHLFFRLQQGIHQTVWSTTGTPETTEALLVPNVTSGFSQARLCASSDHGIFLHWSVVGKGAWFHWVDSYPLRVSPPIPSGELSFQCLTTRIVGDSLLVPATDLLGEAGLWSANGGDGSLTRIAGSMSLPSIVESGDHLGFFLTWSGDDFLPSLWSTDGSAPGTRVLKTGTRFDSIPYLTRADQIARTSDHVFYLYRNDDDTIDLRRASLESTEDIAVAPICATGCTGSSVPYFVERLGEDVVASSSVQPSQSGLLRFVNGSTQPDVVQIPCSSPCLIDHEVSRVNGSLLFTVEGDSAGLDLWQLPLRASTSERVTDFELPVAPPPTLLELEDLTLFRGRIFFASTEIGQESRLPFAARVRSPCELQTARDSCLDSGRFRVGVRWKDFAGGSGTGLSRTFTDSSGYMYFFDDANIEVMVKAVDGTLANGNFWIYYGALSNVEYWIVIEDTVTGLVREYHNPLGAFGSFGDVEAFPSGSSATSATQRDARQKPATSMAGELESQTCFPSSARVCLLDGRFAVEATWTDFEGESGVAFAEPLTSDTGYLWFFDPDVAEILVKLIDGGGLNDHFWVYYGSLSNVEFTLFVTDTVTGETRPYFNPLGSFGSYGDIEAFPAD